MTNLEIELRRNLAWARQLDLDAGNINSHTPTLITQTKKLAKELFVAQQALRVQLHFIEVQHSRSLDLVDAAKACESNFPPETYFEPLFKNLQFDDIPDDLQYDDSFLRGTLESIETTIRPHIKTLHEAELMCDALLAGAIPSGDLKEWLL